MAQFKKSHSGKSRNYSQADNYTIFNLGTPHSFNPTKRVIDFFTNKERTLLEIHQEKVREAKHPLVFIINNYGERI